MKKGVSRFILVGIAVLFVFGALRLMNLSSQNHQESSLIPSETQENEAPVYTPGPSPSVSLPEEVVESTPVSKVNTCRDGDVIRQNVKACSSGLECYSLTLYDDRFCRLPDGTCKFFCTDK